MVTTNENALKHQKGISCRIWLPSLHLLNAFEKRMLIVPFLTENRRSCNSKKPSKWLPMTKTAADASQISHTLCASW